VTITCEIVTGHGSPRVVCNIEPAKSSKLMADRPVRLVRGGHTVASGRGARLSADRELPKGTYTLVIGRGENSIRVRGLHLR
jgi:hypothetical protein